MKFNEKALIKTVKPYYSTARAGDWAHALRVAEWVKKLGSARRDFDILLTAAYVHDIGWSGVAPKGKLNFEQIVNLEKKAARNSPKLIKEVLRKLNYPLGQITKVTRLVRAADQHRSKRLDEAILVDGYQVKQTMLTTFTKQT